MIKVPVKTIFLVGKGRKIAVLWGQFDLKLGLFGVFVMETYYSDYLAVIHILHFGPLI